MGSDGSDAHWIDLANLRDLQRAPGGWNLGWSVDGPQMAPMERKLAGPQFAKGDYDVMTRT